ncbi:MAG: roadblock/LC7 domain-containing protein [Anaerolineae bacterium]|nr:roadblock/LC7 domain-containing protein [Anaerolineae bacterium]
MSWFYEITRSPYIDVALLVDNNGRLVATSNRVGSEAHRVASMIKAAEVLARGLSAEMGRGEIRSLQLSTRNGHVLVLPVGESHYLIVLAGREAPLELIFIYIQRLLDRINNEELAAFTEPVSSLDDVNVDELIDAVSAWLHSGGDPDQF